MTQGICTQSGTVFVGVGSWDTCFILIAVCYCIPTPPRALRPTRLVQFPSHAKQTGRNQGGSGPAPAPHPPPINEFLIELSIELSICGLLLGGCYWTLVIMDHRPMAWGGCCVNMVRTLETIQECEPCRSSILIIIAMSPGCGRWSVVKSILVDVSNTFCSISSQCLRSIASTDHVVFFLVAPTTFWDISQIRYGRCLKRSSLLQFAMLT